MVCRTRCTNPNWYQLDLISDRPYIHEANKNTSTHSRIVRDAIIFSQVERPLPRTPKGNVARTEALKLYTTDIERMYARLGQQSSIKVLGVPGAWKSCGEVESWLIRAVNHLLEREFDANVDLFQQGLDRYVLN